MQDFGRFELQLDRQRLLCAGEPVALGGRAYDLLVALWEGRDRVVDKAELIGRVWPCRVVEENNLQVQIGHLRKILGAEAISTVAGRGYRFTGVTRVAVAGLLPNRGSNEPVRPGLPTPLERLHGREHNLAALDELLRQHRLVTIVGAGGIGKTLLAQHLAEAQRRSHAQGAVWIELDDLIEPGQVAAAIASALGIDATGRGDVLAGLAAALAPLEMLVAIDNAEHRVDEVAAVARAILGSAPGVRLLVTSQAPLLLSREAVHRLGPLSVPEAPLPAAEALQHGAVALFDERARSADAGFRLTDPLVGDVVRLCRRLDGSPLAIELAASRMPLLDLRLLAGLADEPLRLLNRNRKREAPARQQALRAGLQRSLDLLDERERVVFRRLAVFAGGASLDAVQQVVSDTVGPIDGWAVMDALGVLVDRSLVALATADETAEPRYRLLHSTRAFALECLLQAGEQPVVDRRHARWLAEGFGRDGGGDSAAQARTVALPARMPSGTAGPARH